MLTACGFEGWIGALCGCGFEDMWVVLRGSGSASLCSNISR